MLKKQLEAILITSEEPVTVEKLSSFFGVEKNQIAEALKELNKEYETNHCFKLREVAGGWKIFVKPEYSPVVTKFNKKKNNKLGKAALETLAIIAYNQPITKSQIDKIRGVDSSYALRILLEKKLIKIGGRANFPRRPLYYLTTENFLRLLGIKSIEELPRPEEV